jgi:hypothetical protein
LFLSGLKIIRNKHQESTIIYHQLKMLLQKKNVLIEWFVINQNIQKKKMMGKEQAGCKKCKDIWLMRYSGLILSLVPK